MRVTTSSIYESARQQVGVGQKQAADLRDAISTGVKVETFADDPQAAYRIVRDTGRLADIEAHRGSLSRVGTLLGVSENQLDNAANIINRVRELATQMASDTYNASNRTVAADEIVQLRAQLVSIANSRADGRYIFGGIGNAAPPFDAAGNFGGDTNTLTVAVTRTLTMSATLPGGEPFEDPSGGPSVFQTLDAIEVALRADNGPAVGVLIDEVVTHHDRLTVSQQQLGGLFRRIDTISEALDRTELATTETLSAARDTDFATAILSLTQTEESLRAALATTARIDQLSLLNYI
ncbi:MAG: flagellar hook-associated protein FlgL [Deltaproteobacteria bacterium]